MDRVRKFGWVYFAGFMAVVAVGYVPQLHDPQGNLFGLFKPDLYDDSLHFFSGVWAGISVARASMTPATARPTSALF